MSETYEHFLNSGMTAKSKLLGTLGNRHGLVHADNFKASTQEIANWRERTKNFLENQIGNSSSTYFLINKINKEPSNFGPTEKDVEIIAMYVQQLIENLLEISKRHPLKIWGSSPLQPLPIEEILKQTENEYLEFKGSLRWCYREDKQSKIMEEEVQGAVAAFSNSEIEGLLIIGVNNEGKVLGLKKDYETFKNKNREGFLLKLNELIYNQLGNHLYSTLKIDFLDVDGEDVCRIVIKPSNTPTWMTINGKEEFFLRRTSSSQKLSPKEASEYIKQRF
jgi:hypothetical protein